MSATNLFDDYVSDITDIEHYEGVCKHCGYVFEPEDEVRTTRDICDDCLQEYPDMAEIKEYE